MLSDAEQHQLTAIESQLREDDPRFARRLSGGWDRRSRTGRWSGWPAALTSLACVAVVAVGLVATNVAVVVVAMTALGANAGLWISEGRRPRRRGFTRSEEAL